ncbi:MAG: DMT family transporter [Solirubrobacteraceae bacterium]|nr:DMT family transporter [Solirubrobacteraceae bacterium]
MLSKGAFLCLASAAAFGAMGIFGKLAYDEGVTVQTLLSVRFVIAATAMWAFVIGTGRAGFLRELTRRDILLALALGGIGYSAQSGAYFAALERIDASLLGLLLYTFPSMVAVAAIVLGREPRSWRTALAVTLASGGLVLVLAGAAGGTLDPLGTALGITTAVVYATYILSSQGVAGRIGPLAMTTFVCTGAAITPTVIGLLLGGIDLGSVTPAGYGWLTAIALVSTVGAIALFFAGLPIVGPTAASILSTFEPVVTVALAYAAFGEALGPVQLVGGVLVLLAVVAVQARRTDPVVAAPGV